MFGIPMKPGPTRVTCDNLSVVKNSSLIKSTLNRNDNSILYLHARWNVATGIVDLSWIKSKDNLADAFTKRLTSDQRDDLLHQWTY